MRGSKSKRKWVCVRAAGEEQCALRRDGSPGGERAEQARLVADPQPWLSRTPAVLCMGGFWVSLTELVFELILNDCSRFACHLCFCYSFFMKKINVHFKF